MPRRVTLDPDELLSTLGTGIAADDVTERILDAAAELFARHGIGRCSVEEVAERSGLGRTTVYRRFGSRRALVDAVLARECRRFFGEIIAATDHIDRFEDLVVEGFLVGLSSVESSVLAGLVRSEPDLFRLLTVDAGPVLTAAADVLAAAYGPTDRPDHVRFVAEILVRLAISMLLVPSAGLDPDDPVGARAALHGLLDPVLVPLGEERSLAAPVVPGR